MLCPSNATFAPDCLNPVNAVPTARRRAGANLAWSGAASGLITGVGYLLDVPQDAALPVDQTVVVEAAWRY